ncbi:PD-(D/E)XK nuclease family protein [Heliophilum fasciatum]|uniref:PD-(D/E)XK nuclease family protein n=1 Tax=Heliophilum fasciatum TaxID=35700 RepID=UPI001FAA69C6|nr:PD-(D/E)XK nuclease family protein [Heliophilum fasciatum]MCW2278700.1 CRISPR/Cas system-associated exonuclease Cas4 (RecB family) [Heliophilum fasciatum]
MVRIGSLVSRTGAKELRDEVVSWKSERSREVTTAILDHFDAIHSLDVENDIELERYFLQDELDGLDPNRQGVHFQPGVTTFSPSSAYKCERELYYKATRTPKSMEDRFPYQRRWARNGTAVHAAVQRDLLYAEKYLKHPRFKVRRLPNGSPAWERNIRQVRLFDEANVPFQIHGMMDGILTYRDGSSIGLEFKTKSTTIATVGSYRMKDAQDDHKLQCVAYSLLFDLDEFLIVYESLAKDSWMKGGDAKPDMRAFYLHVTDEDRSQLIDKFARVASMVKARKIPPADPTKCIFCPYKPRCQSNAAEAA